MEHGNPFDVIFEVLLRLMWRVVRLVLDILTLGRFGRWYDRRVADARDAAKVKTERFWQATAARDQRRSADWERQLAHLVGRTGRTTTALRPTGRVEIDDAGYDARVEAGLIDGGEPIRVVRAEGPTLYVERSTTASGQPEPGADPA